MSAGWIVWLLSVGGCAVAFTVIGVYALRRKEPMWFWSGTSVRREELTDVKAYNRANGIMWIGYSIPFWISMLLYYWLPTIAETILVLSCMPGIIVLIFVYQRIYRKYRKFDT